MLRDNRGDADNTFDPARLDESWRQLLAMPEQERGRWLSTLEAADPGIAASLRLRLQGLSEETSDRVGAAEAFSERARTDVAAPPRRFGNFKLIRQLGVGGMGEVWLAEQDHPRRQVALKLIRGGLGSDDASRRFQREATLAGRAEHPAIARIYEAGNVTSEQGTVPYLAMEYVVGSGLREYINEQRPALRARLQLLAVIADAVHHAHVRGVVHRDLKPQNIMITPEGAPKVLDFGVARALEDATPGATRMTEHGQLVGTLAYMSPEQLDGDPLRVDARSDVYALGVIAYEVLSGRAAFRIGDSSVLEALRERARQRPDPLGRADPLLRGDIELIVMKALADEPDQRYQSALELADDLRRFLAAQPIRARAPTRAYLWSRFVRRNRLPLIASALVLGAIVAGAVVSVRYALSEAAARREAELRTAKAEAVTGFLHDMLANADPAKARGRDLKLSEVLAGAARALSVSPPREPQVEAEVRAVLVEIFRNLGDYPSAQAQIAAAQQAARRGYGELSPEVLDLDRNEAAVLVDLEKVELAEQRLRTLRERASGAALTPELDLGMATLQARIEMVRGNFEAALTATDEALARSSLAPTHPVRLAARANRLITLTDLGRFDDAERETLALIDDKTAMLGAEHPEVLKLRGELAVVYDGQGKAAQAEALLREVLADESRIYGVDNVEPVATSINLVKQLIDRGALDEAEPMLDHAIAIQVKLFGEDHERVRLARNMRAVLFEERGAPERAVDEYQAIIDSYERTVGLDHPEALVARNNLAKLYLNSKKHPEAVAAYRAIVTDAEGKLGKEHFYTAIFLGNYGDALRQAGDADAVAVLEDALARCSAALGADHERTLKVSEWLKQAKQ